MISRQWCGLAKPEHAGRYIQHLQHETFPALKNIAGFVTASILRRKLDCGIEFMIITHWESMEAITQFAGQDTEAAVVPDKVKEMMVGYDRVVRHYEVVEQIRTTER